MAHSMLSIVDFFSLESGLATEFRRLLHNLQSIGKEREMKAIMVTSSMLAEGKSTVAAFMALTAAKKGVKTLVVDADLRRPTMHKLFGVSRELGMAEILTDNLPVKTAIKKTASDKLDVITAGKINPYPAEIFDAAAIGRIITEMKFYYDLVVIDCAPVIPVSDPMLLAQEVDGILFVIKAGTTQRDIVQRATAILNSTSNKLVGAVMNNSDGSLPYYYNHDYYGYDYKQRPRDLQSSQGKSARPRSKRSTGDERPRNDNPDASPAPQKKNTLSR